MTLVLEPISSPDAERDLVIDLTGALEADETLVDGAGGTDVTSSNTDILEISSVQVNTAEIIQDDVTIAIGKAVTFHIKTLVRAKNDKFPLAVRVVGNSGTAENYEVKQPIVYELES